MIFFHSGDYFEEQRDLLALVMTHAFLTTKDYLFGRIDCATADFISVERCPQFAILNSEGIIEQRIVKGPLVLQLQQYLNLPTEKQAIRMSMKAAMVTKELFTKSKTAKLQFEVIEKQDQ